jgi:hypothetical protein
MPIPSTSPEVLAERQTRRALRRMAAAGAGDDEIRDARRRLADPSF